ncbi:hypothetical protein BJV74DRAFT_869585 [Russula compacta]|nr:hypothetical protein BJV74DRAFT_869585 [Russula compacta]
MLIAKQEASQRRPCNIPTFWLSALLTLNLRFDSEPFYIPGSPEYCNSLRSPTGSPFEYSSSDFDYDPLSVGSAGLFSTVREPPFSRDASPVGREGTDIPAIVERNALGLEFTFEADVLGTKAIATSSPQTESLRAPRRHKDDRSCDRPNWERHALQEHLALQPDSPANETLASECPQDTCLRADVGDSYGFKKFLGLYESPQKAHPCGRSPKPDRDDDLKDWLSTHDLGAGAAAAGLGTCPVNAQRYECKIQCAPRLRTIELPEENGSAVLYEELPLSKPDSP